MSEVDVTPEHLRDAGDTVTGIREGIADSGGFEGVQERGMSGNYMLDDAGRLSGGFFNMSLLADEFMFQRNQEMLMARADIEQNLIALASALHIAADVYEGGDVANAIEFAFVNSDIVPEGLPDGGGVWDWDQTYSDRQEEAAQVAEEERQNGETPPGGDGSENEGQATSGERSVPFTTHTDGYGGPPTSGTRYYDADDNLLRTEYVTYHDDGSRTVTTWVDGEKTDEVTHSPGFDEAIDRQIGEGETQMEQAMEEAGFDPDNPEEW